MQFFLRQVDGVTRHVSASPSDTVDFLGLADGEHAVVNGKALNADDILGESLESNCTVFVSGGLIGGGKKRKKKTYTKPKKQKHKRKKVKLAVLKYYKVDGNNKVQKLRRDCPHEMCGSGVFMAMHTGRYYCGKCHLTYLIKKGDDES